MSRACDSAIALTLFSSFILTSFHFVLVLTGIKFFFFHIGLYGTMFWICAEKSVDDNTGMFLLLLSCAYTESRPFPLLTPPHQQVGWGCTRSWERTQLGQLTPNDQRDIPIPYDVVLSNKTGGSLQGLPCGEQLGFGWGFLWFV